MTFVDTTDLRDRTCPECGAVRGDMLAHTDWHRRQDAAWDDVSRALLRLLEQVDQ